MTDQNNPDSAPDSVHREAVRWRSGKGEPTPCAGCVRLEAKLALYTTHPAPFDKYGVVHMAERATLAEAETAALREELEAPPAALLDRWMQNELADYRMVLDHCSRTYDHFSGGRISKPNTLPEEVFQVADELESERTTEDIREATEDLRDEAAALRRDLEAAREETRAMDRAGLEAARVLGEKDAETIATLRRVNAGLVAALMRITKVRACGAADCDCHGEVMQSEARLALRDYAALAAATGGSDAV